MTSVIEIPLDQVISNGNVRSEVDSDLAPTLGEHGQKVEIRVYPLNGHFVIDSGHRRVKAARELEWETIRAVVVAPPANPAQRLINQTIENEERKGLSYMEKAQVYQQLRNDHGMKQVEIARTFGVSESKVSLAIATLELPDKLQDAVNDGTLTPSAVEPLLSQDKETQEELADAVISAKTARKVSALVKTKNNQAAVNAQIAQVSDIPDNADPLEAVVVDSLRKALENIDNATITQVTNPVLTATARSLLDRIWEKLATIQDGLEA